MVRHRRPYTLFKRKDRKGVWYYRLADDPKRVARSTGERLKHEAVDFVEKELANSRTNDDKTLAEFLEPYYVWGRCPHVSRLVGEKKRVGEQHVRHQRALIAKYVLTDEKIARKNVHELRRGDILDFRGRLLEKKVTDRQANRIIGALKTCLKEGVYREELDRDPTAGIGNIRQEVLERGVFTMDELRALFPAKGNGPWTDLRAYTVFLVAATVGARRGEILALRWRDIDLDRSTLNIERAWKDETTLGEPKWGKARKDIPIPTTTAARLRAVRTESIHVMPDALVFCTEDGSRLSTRWWQTEFRAAVKKADIHAAGRRLTAHSFRHSLNTILRDRGVPAEKIRAAMGWTNEKTQDSYTHFGAEHLRAQADLVDGLLNEEADGPNR
jgi:integrase